MLTRMAIVLVSLALASCGADRAADPVEPTPVAPARAETPAPSQAAPEPECATSADCSFTSVRDVQTVADCACPTCDGPALSVARLTAIGDRYESICGAWRVEHACTPPICAQERLALCVDGRCLAEPVVDSATGVPSPCRSPADCAGGVACVRTALGGNLGCTGESCCGAAECSNACATDADCPACRPACVSGSCGRPH
jgi:hypothetical protein